MKALISREPGGPDTLTMAELPEPVAATGELVVSVRAVGINFPDALIIEDKYQFKPPRPFAPGGEVSGVVEAVGPDVTGFEIGDRVFGLCGWKNESPFLPPVAFWLLTTWISNRRRPF
jgi:NADPH:quinone reductase-like Zn-dependent oxidoreductase